MGGDEAKSLEDTEEGSSSSVRWQYYKNSCKFVFTEKSYTYLVKAEYACKLLIMYVKRTRFLRFFEFLL